MTHEQIIKTVLSSPELITDISVATQTGGVTIYENYEGVVSVKRTPAPSNSWNNKPEINIPSAHKGKGLNLTHSEVVDFLNEEIDVLEGYSYSPKMAVRLGLDATV